MERYVKEVYKDLCKLSAEYYQAGKISVDTLMEVQDRLDKAYKSAKAYLITSVEAVTAMCKVCYDNEIW